MWESSWFFHPSEDIERRKKRTLKIRIFKMWTLSSWWWIKSTFHPFALFFMIDSIISIKWNFAVPFLSHWLVHTVIPNGWKWWKEILDGDAHMKAPQNHRSVWSTFSFMTIRVFGSDGDTIKVSDCVCEDRKRANVKGKKRNREQERI